MPQKPIPIPVEKFSAPAQRALASAGYTTLQQLSKVTEKQIAALHGLGPSTIAILKKELAAHGLSFARP